jgi:4-amino-4-deoxy-L-arabinose transferase-like glycosyltransferase
MRKIDVVFAWLLIALGAVHVSLTVKFDPSLGLDAIWFASGGLLIIMIGALNLLRVTYTNVAKGVSTVSVISNVVLLALMVWMATRLSMRSNPQVVVGLILAGLLTAFSVLRRGDH